MTLSSYLKLAKAHKRVSKVPSCLDLCSLSSTLDLDSRPRTIEGAGKSQASSRGQSFGPSREYGRPASQWIHSGVILLFQHFRLFFISYSIIYFAVYRLSTRKYSFLSSFRGSQTAFFVFESALKSNVRYLLRLKKNDKLWYLTWVERGEKYIQLILNCSRLGSFCCN